MAKGYITPEIKNAYLWLQQDFVDKLKSGGEFKTLVKNLSSKKYKDEVFIYHLTVDKQGRLKNLRRYGSSKDIETEQQIERVLNSASPFNPPPNNLTEERGIHVDILAAEGVTLSVRLLQSSEKDVKRRDVD